MTVIRKETALGSGGAGGSPPSEEINSGENERAEAKKETSRALGGSRRQKQRIVAFG